MSATRALKNNSFVAMHVGIKVKTEQLAKNFYDKYGYRPPYWKLVKMARSAKEDILNE